MSITKKPIEYWFWRQAVSGVPSTCWEWSGKRMKKGYGIFSWHSSDRTIKINNAHRASWFIHFGPIPEGLQVLHSCDNPPCVNPQHLFLGTNLDNSNDKWSKGRGRFGERMPNAKLTQCAAEEIRNLAISEDPAFSPKLLAQKYGVSTKAIQLVATGVTWKRYVEQGVTLIEVPEDDPDHTPNAPRQSARMVTRRRLAASAKQREPHKQFSLFNSQ